MHILQVRDECLENIQNSMKEKELEMTTHLNQLKKELEVKNRMEPLPQVFNYSSLEREKKIVRKKPAKNHEWYTLHSLSRVHGWEEKGKTKEEEKVE